MPLTQFPASVDVRTLTGSNGFAITGFSAFGAGDSTVNGAGDLNADGIVDLIVGGPSGITGICYVIFGKNGIGSTDTFDVTALTGVNGFTITGFPAGSHSETFSNAGDLNNDGITDLVIGTGGIYFAPGTSYVIFGKRGIGANGNIDVSTLTGANGFAITGFIPRDGTDKDSGASVSFAGDLNNDGIADLVIGAPYSSNSVGIVYVIFGNSAIGNSGILSVSSLTGSNGFSITGFPAASLGGWSVSGCGDINADGIADLVIDAPQASPTGVSYVIFGKSGIGSGGSLSVSSLTGSNGFAITGFPAGSSGGGSGGYSVSSAGDLNVDGIVDLVVGATGAPNGGASYVIFGKNGIGSSGTLDVGTLTGNNGFVISGSGGWSVRNAGDLNYDGITDLIIGTPNNNPGPISYVIFGKSGIGSGGIFDVSTLIGTNGFAITGFDLGRFDGSVSGCGDLNADGIEDIVVGMYNARSYVIFGDSATNLLTNHLTITKGQFAIIDNTNLNATSINFPNRNPNLIFTINNPKWGHFEQLTAPGVAITQFTQQQVSLGQIQFIDDDSVFAPSYSVSVSDGGFAGFFPSLAANITFIHRGPLLVQNILSINQNQTLIVSPHFLNAIDQDNPADTPTLIFTISNVQHGQFESIYYPGVPITSFTEGQVQSYSVQFVQDGSLYAPSYNVQVSDGAGGIVTAPEAAIVSFNLPPILVNNNFSINQGQALILSSANLSATDPDMPDSSLIFSVNAIKHGHFELVGNPGTVITSFTQGQVLSRDVQFIPDGSTTVPSFMITVSDSAITLQSVAAKITLNLRPILQSNTLTIKQAERIVLTTANLSATDPNGAATSLSFIVNNVQYGYFALSSAPLVAITSFSQAQVQSGLVQFVQDGSPNAPSYNVMVSDGKISTVASPCIINFDAAPVLTSNQLSIDQAQEVIITPSDLSASDKETAAGNLLFTAQAVTHGHFEDSSNPGAAVTQFFQQKIFSAAMKFVTDGSPFAPSYNISVSDGSLTSPPLPALISFSPSENTTSASNNVVRNAIIGATVSGGIGLLFLAAKLAATYKANQYMKKTFEGGSDSEKALAEYHKQIIQPLVNKIFDQIKTTGFLGYRSEIDTQAYIMAIEFLVGRLVAAGINLETETVGVAKQTRLFNEIVRQIREQLIPGHRCCSTTYWYSFFKIEVSPSQMRENADKIAKAVAQTLGKAHSQTLEMQRQKLDAKAVEIELLEKQMEQIDEGFEAMESRFDKIKASI